MPRSSKKPPFIAKSILKQIIKYSKSGNKSAIIRTKARSSTIVPELIGITFGVYNGKDYIPVTINERMVPLKLGEFSPTRNFGGHSGDKKVTKKK